MSKQIVEVSVDASRRICYMLSIIQTITEEGVYSLETSYLGEPPQAAKIGLLQAVLDMERKKMLSQWGNLDE